MPALGALGASGALDREYREYRGHRQEWFLRSGGSTSVNKGLARGTIHFSAEHE